VRRSFVSARGNTLEQPTSEIRFPARRRIYIVEDEMLVLEDIKTRLEDHGYEIAGTATSGKQAIDGIKQMQPDVVIMDVRIAGELNGIEVAIIVQSYFETPIPIIFLTGFSQETFHYLKVLPDYIYINKPFRETVLLDAIDRAFQKIQQERSQDR
jgi:YesN/AraC family two-component response regulator